MDGFQTTILGVAVVILILILAVVGITMANNKANLLFPPTSLPCPNYWQINPTDGSCIIPTTTINNIKPANIGTWNSTTSTPGYNNGATINFNDTSWGSAGKSATCAKQDWAKKYGILWDGVSNYNGCT